jgi:ComF family protein
VDYLLKRLKFSSELAIAPLLAGLLAEHIAARAAPLPDLLLAVPLHRTRLRERGFNQATLLATRLGRRLGVPVASQVCLRRRATQPQSLLSPTARRLNLRNAFAVQQRLPAAHVAIIDDVMTTGHTAGELAQALKQAGAECVEVWVIARAAH